jgi:hypothetical protein
MPGLSPGDRALESELVPPAVSCYNPIHSFITKGEEGEE